MVYGKIVGTKKTPQSEPIIGKDMVQNNAGGYGFAIDDWKRLDRFILLGSEAGTYYVDEKKLTRQNAESVIRCIQSDGKRVVDRIVEISQSGRAPKNSPAIFALALCCSLGNTETRQHGFNVMPKVCRIGTHLFEFVENIKHLRGKGHGLRRALASWYLDKEVDALAYQVIKYRNREGWTHRDVLRISHPKTDDALRNGLLSWVVGKSGGLEKPDPAPALIRVYEVAQSTKDTDELCNLIVDHKLPRESIPTEWLSNPKIWDALLRDMPMTAMIRNLGNISKVGLLTPMSEASGLVCDRLGDQNYLKRARIHPVAILMALKTYSQGQGMRGSGKWEVVPQVVDALDEAFYKCFEYLEPTGKRWLLGIDVSGSMSWSGMGKTPLRASEGAAALAMTVVKTESQYYCHGFSSEFRDLGISKNMRLNDVLSKAESMAMGRTDCALPMTHALKKRIPVDVFVVLTDNETWYGQTHPCQALQEYREKMGIGAKLIVVGMTASQFTIADPNDSGTLDVVGFDAALPRVMADFATQ